MSNQLSSLTSSPTRSPITLCNPTFCDGIHPRPLTPIQFEEQAKILISKSRVACLHQAMEIVVPTEDPMGDYLYRLSTSDLESIETQAAMNKFVECFLPVLQDKDLEANSGLFTHFITSLGANMLDATRKKGCIYSWSEKVFTDVWKCLSAEENAMMIFETDDVLEKNFDLLQSKKGWTRFQVQKLRENIIARFGRALVTKMDGTPIYKWLLFVEKSMSGTQLLQYAEVMNSIPKNCWSGAEDKSSLHIPFIPVIELFWVNEIIEGTGSIGEDLLHFKQSAGHAAKIGNWLQAIDFYNYMNFFGADGPHLLQSLTNSALLRLKLSQLNPNHLLFVVLECTLALQIDSNHVKALFRRGLALALCKKWNEAIVDFERAVELDPLSPAKKELEVARRQVTRRMGN